MDGQGFLRETARLVERGWCTGADARDRFGTAVAASHSSAEAWSLLGALISVFERPEADERSLRDALWGISGVISDGSLDAWNNAENRTQRDTLRILARAQIALGEQPPPEEGWSRDMV